MYQLGLVTSSVDALYSAWVGMAQGAAYRPEGEGLGLVVEWRI